MLFGEMRLEPLELHMSLKFSFLSLLGCDMCISHGYNPVLWRRLFLAIKLFFKKKLLMTVESLLPIIIHKRKLVLTKFEMTPHSELRGLVKCEQKGAVLGLPSKGTAFKAYTCMCGKYLTHS